MMNQALQIATWIPFHVVATKALCLVWYSPCHHFLPCVSAPLRSSSGSCSCCPSGSVSFSHGLWDTSSPPPFWILSLPLYPALPLLSPMCDPSLCPNSGSSHLPHSPKSSQSGFCAGMPIPLLLHVIPNMYFFLAGVVSLITINE